MVAFQRACKPASFKNACFDVLLFESLDLKMHFLESNNYVFLSKNAFSIQDFQKVIAKCLRIKNNFFCTSEI